MNAISLKKISLGERQEFKQKIQEAFGLALAAHFKNPPVVPSNTELDAAFNNLNNDTYFIYSGKEKIGGAVIHSNPYTHINSLELFFIYKNKHSTGLGSAAWKAIEKQYPQPKIWQTITPYFEKRNIHFYVNKCGFHIVEFCNKHHPCQDENYSPGTQDNVPGTDEFFRFEKVMQPFTGKQPH